MLLHNEYILGMLGLMKVDDGYFKDEINKPIVGTKRICMEPTEFLTLFNDSIGNKEKCREIFLKKAEEFQVINVEASDRYWFNTTQYGINLRPGRQNGDTNSPKAIIMGRLDQVHALIAGRTGSGKSVLLNNLILNLLTEYAPWELDLYMIDFKKVEFSGYMDKEIRPPHINVIAATEDRRYVISLFRKLYQYMLDRQTFFARIGVKNIAEFREKFQDLIMPRILIIVDEFQQLYAGSEMKFSDEREVSALISGITKLGRATGFHLLFASQEMRGALGQNDLANFKIRFALKCDSDVSSQILGNSEAAALERGYVYVNTESGKAEDNKKFQVPNIEEPRNYFYTYLKKMKEKTPKNSFCKEQHFYQEDEQEEFYTFHRLLEKLKKQIRKIQTKEGTQYFTPILLGQSVIYRNSLLNYESFFIERGKNKNILVVSPDAMDIAYMEKLFAVNFFVSYEVNQIMHMCFHISSMIKSIYNIEEEGRHQAINIKGFNAEEYVRRVSLEYEDRVLLLECLNGKITPLIFLKENYEIPTESAILKEIERGIFEELSIRFDLNQEIDTYCDIVINSLDDIRESIRNSLKQNGDIEAIDYYINRFLEQVDGAANYLKNKYKIYRQKGGCFEQVVKPCIIWVNGIEGLQDIEGAEKLGSIYKNAMDVNMLFIFMASNIDTSDSCFYSIRKSCNYFFASGNQEDIYEKMQMPYREKKIGSIVVDFKIKTVGYLGYFKKCKNDLKEYVLPRLNFDNIDMETV